MSRAHGKRRTVLAAALAYPAAVWLATCSSFPVAAQTFEEIVVTAQKREQPAQDVGISITAFTAEHLRGLSMRRSDELASQTPGLQATSFGGDPTVALFAIRGVGQNDFADHHEGPTAIYVDGAYVSALGAAGFQMFDLERVEVLRGPQGTLFGRNATGGLVHYVSAPPAADFEAHARFDLGEYDQVGLEGVLNGPLGERVRARFAGTTLRNDGYLSNRIGGDVRETDMIAARLQLEFDLGADFDLLWKLHGASDDDARGGGFAHRAAIPGADGLGEFLPPDVNADLFGLGSCPGCDALGYQDVDGDEWGGAFDAPGLFNRDAYGSTVTLNWDRRGFTFTSITDLLDLEKTYGEDSDGSPNPLLAYETFQDARQLSQELRVAGDDGDWAWTAGLYYLVIDGDYTNLLDSPLFLAAELNAYALETRSWAVFGHVEYALNPRWRLVAGLRYTEDEKDYSFVPSCAGDGCLGFFVFPGLGAVGDIGAFTPATAGALTHMDDDDVAGKLQAEWSPSGDLLVYAGVTRGNKAGGFNAPVDALLLPEQMRYEPEVLTSYEVGFKSTLADGRLRLNGDVFHYDYDDKQAFTFSGLTTYLLNRSSQVDGLELELAARPSDALELVVGLALLDATVDAVPLPSGRAAEQEMAQAPDVTVNGMIRRAWAVGNGSLRASLAGSYVAEAYYNTINHPTARADSYLVWDGRVAFAPTSGNWEAALFVKNLTEEKAVVYAIDASAFGYSLQTYAPPRWIGAEFQYRWN